MKIFVANWKLNPSTLAEAKKLVQSLNKVKTKQKVILCPPAVYLPLLKSKYDLGAQDMFWQETGAFTGQLSGSMLKQFGIKYVIIGHSERREIGETDAEINLKIKAALANKLQPILCVGHGLTENESDEDVMLHLQQQLETDLRGVDASKVMVAYEPVWAIGSGHAEMPEHAERLAMFIKIKFKVKKVLYGGSTNHANSKQFLKKQIDGLLVGHSSLVAEEFSQMII